MVTSIEKDGVSRIGRCYRAALTAPASHIQRTISRLGMRWPWI